MRLFSLFVLLFIFSVDLFGRVTCRDFNTQAEAQRYFDARKAYWKKLDGDKDGEPCECLRGGSSYDKRVCRKWRERYGKR